MCYGQPRDVIAERGRFAKDYGGDGGSMIPAVSVSSPRENLRGDDGATRRPHPAYADSSWYTAAGLYTAELLHSLLCVHEI